MRECGRADRARAGLTLECRQNRRLRESDNDAICTAAFHTSAGSLTAGGATEESVVRETFTMAWGAFQTAFIALPIERRVGEARTL